MQPVEIMDMMAMKKLAHSPIADVESQNNTLPLFLKRKPSLNFPVWNRQHEEIAFEHRNWMSGDYRPSITTAVLSIQADNNENVKALYQSDQCHLQTNATDDRAMHRTKDQ